MHPNWFNPNGYSLELSSYSFPLKFLSLKSEFSELGIIKEHCFWIVKWRIINPKYSFLGVNGSILMTNDQLRTAFELEGDELIVVQGFFAKKGLYLNIPCMGTGGSNDPNVSLYITKEISQIVMKLLE
jgi:hypothetical protein